MKKYIVILSAMLLFTLCSCGGETAKENTIDESINENIVEPDFEKAELDEKFGTDEIYIVKTYAADNNDDFEKYLDENKIFTKIKHYQLSDGTWKTDNYSYKYKLVLTGRMNNAAKDSTYEVLSNSDDITFDMAWKAAGFSSNMDDYFKEEDAVIVAVG